MARPRSRALREFVTAFAVMINPRGEDGVATRLLLAEQSDWGLEASIQPVIDDRATSSTAFAVTRSADSEDLVLKGPIDAARGAPEREYLRDPDPSPAFSDRWRGGASLDVEVTADEQGSLTGQGSAALALIPAGAEVGVDLPVSGTGCEIAGAIVDGVRAGRPTCPVTDDRMADLTEPLRSTHASGRMTGPSGPLAHRTSKRRDPNVSNGSGEHAVNVGPQRAPEPFPDAGSNHSVRLDDRVNQVGVSSLTSMEARGR